MQNLTIDPEFRDKIPPLSAEEAEKLEENILADGEIREPLVVWNNTIIDGHHRWAIIQKHPEIPYKIKRMEFSDKWAAIVWMCRNQLGRRNLTDEQKMYLIGKEYEAQKLTVGNHAEKTRREDGTFTVRPENRGIRGKTRDIVAKEHGVGVSKVDAAARYAKSLDGAETISPGVKSAVLSGEVNVPMYVVESIRKVPEEKRPNVVEAIKKGDTAAAKAIIKEATAEKEEPLAPFSAAELAGLIRAAGKNLNGALEQHLVLVHGDLLNTEEGRKAADQELARIAEIVEKYREMIRRKADAGTD